MASGPWRDPSGDGERAAHSGGPRPRLQGARTGIRRLGRRHKVPIDTYLRLMFLKFRYRLGYELLCREVADSISWQRFCRIPLGGRVPHPSTLVKLARRLASTPWPS
jgi:IS5 family transposase